MNMKVMYRKGKTVRVRRGGSWNGSPSYLRAANRFNIGPSALDCDVGARLSKSLKRGGYK